VRRHWPQRGGTGQEWGGRGGALLPPAEAAGEPEGRVGRWEAGGGWIFFIFKFFLIIF